MEEPLYTYMNVSQVQQTKALHTVYETILLDFTALGACDIVKHAGCASSFNCALIRLLVT